MKRRIKPIPVTILLVLIASSTAFYMGWLPSFKDIRDFTRADQVYITENTSWSLSDSPVIIDRPIYVDYDVLLTISPGVDIQISKDVAIVIDGSLQANGTEEQPVRFRLAPGEKGNWTGIFFSTSCGYTYSHETIPDWPLLNYVSIEDANYGVQSESCPVDVLNSTITSCKSGVIFQNNTNSRVENNLFQNCGEAILIQQQKEMGTPEMISVLNNEFHDCDHITLTSSVNFRFNYIHDFNTSYSAVLIAPPDSHRVHFFGNRLENVDRALELGTIKNAEVKINQNCFDSNGTNLYLNCNRNKDASIIISENTFHNYKTYNVKAISGCTRYQEDRIPLDDNWWGSSDQERINNSIWEYSPASAVKYDTYRFFPAGCAFPEKSGDTKLVKLVDVKKASAKVEEKGAVLKKDSLRELEKKPGVEVSSKGSFLIINGDTINLPENENIAPLLDSIMKSKFNTNTAVSNKSSELIKDGQLTIPDEAIVQNFAFDDPGPKLKVYVCKKGVYTAFKHEGTTIYGDEGAKILLYGSGEHIVYLAKNAEVKVSKSSKNNVIYYHPEAKLEGELGKDQVKMTMKYPDLRFEITKEKRANSCLTDRIGNYGN